MITIRYFGVLQDSLACAQEEMDWSGGSSIELLKCLRARGHIWEEALAPENIFKLAVNEEIIHDDDVYIKDGASVAILPPVTGG